MTDDQALHEYARTGSSDAFRELADRYVDLVYSSAKRQLIDPHIAEDATQAVFIILAKRARTIKAGVPLSGWLYRATRYVCNNAQRQAARRHLHEQKAAQMRAEATADASTPQSDDELKPLIDAAMSSLATKDRNAILLRYFQKQSIEDVSANLGISPDAARKRIARAIERLGEYFKRKGITTPLASIDAALLAIALEAAPHAIHQSAVAALGASASAYSSTLAKGAIFMMTLKTNLAVASTAAVLLLGVGTVVAVHAANGTTSPPAADHVAARDPQKAAQLTQEGWQLWSQRQFAQAEVRFKAATKLDPKLLDAWNGLGWSQFNQGNAAAAQISWQKVIAIDPNHAAAQNGLGWIAFNANDQKKAEQHWLIAAKTPGASASWSGLAKVYLLQGKWDQAKTYADKLVQSGDDSAKPLLEAAITKQLSPELKSQIEPPPPATAGANDIAKGWQLLNQGKVDDAVAIFRVAVSKEPKNANAYNSLGWGLMRTRNHTDAQAQFEQALKLDPTHGGAMNGLAILLKEQGKTREAIDLWTKLDASTPEQTNAGTYGLARTYLEEKQYDKALPFFQRLAKDLPNDDFVQKGLQESQSHAGSSS